MNCKKQKAVKIDERSVKEQEYWKVSRIWDKVVNKQSSTNFDMEIHGDEIHTGHNRSPCRNLRGEKQTDPYGELQEQPVELNPAALLRKAAKQKSFGRRKSPLQKFDEIVTRELMNRQVEEDESLSPFEGPQKWPSNLEFSCSKVTPSNRKLSFDTSISKIALHNAEKELKNRGKDPSEVESCGLMEAIEKLIQAQASCRFDAAVKAAEAAASSVPLELAEEVALTCARDYQSQIIDIVNEKIAGQEGNKPIEVIGYIGITKKQPVEDDDYR